MSHEEARTARGGRGPVQEDVLDTIRRLAREEAAPGRVAPLVLSPEHRVTEGRARPEVDGAELARRRAAVLAFVPGPEPAPAREAPLPAAPAATALADEDALRALVAEVVREELRGALGERITRNVRRMVRREIAMELAARPLD